MMKTQENFIYSGTNQEYVLRLSAKCCKCWILLIPFFIAIILIIIILLIYF